MRSSGSISSLPLNINNITELNDLIFRTELNIWAESFFRTPDGMFATVRYKGHYDAFCSQYQEFERHNISYKEAKEISWSFFGTCGHVMVFLDQDGNVINEEKGGIF